MFLHDCDPPDSTVRVTAVFWSATAFDWASYCISTAQVNAAFCVFCVCIFGVVCLSKSTKAFAWAVHFAMWVNAEFPFVHVPDFDDMIFTSINIIHKRDILFGFWGSSSLKLFHFSAKKCQSSFSNSHKLLFQLNQKLNKKKRQKLEVALGETGGTGHTAPIQAQILYTNKGSHPEPIVQFF